MKGEGRHILISVLLVRLTLPNPCWNYRFRVVFEQGAVGNNFRDYAPNEYPRREAGLTRVCMDGDWYPDDEEHETVIANLVYIHSIRALSAGRHQEFLIFNT